MKRMDWSEYALSLLRIVAAALFVCHGLQKLFGVPVAAGPQPHFGSLLWIAGVLESIGGVCILLGLFTRPIAFVLCGEMAIAYFHTHAPRAFWPIKNGGELAILFCFLFLYLCFAGAGRLSADRLMRSKR
jgi:putative oxidoreductase